MAADVEIANRSVGEDDAVFELVADPFVDRRTDDFVDALPVVRMNDVPVPREAGLIETYVSEVFARGRLGASLDR